LSNIRVGIVGVGNCASALLQGIQFYGKREEEKETIGIRHLYLGGLHPRDIQIVSAFDIDIRKVGKDLSQAIFVEPNNTSKIVDVPPTGVEVSRGPVMDGVGEYTRGIIKISSGPEKNVSEVLEHTDTEILINLLPSGATKASEWYAEQSIDANCAFVNCTPHFIASDSVWSRRFEKAGLPLVGDDLVDQVGATALHKTLLGLLSEEGVRITQTYQLDVGGGTESLDTLDRSREIKRTVKTESVEAALPYKAEVVAGSTDYVDFMRNKRDSYFWINGVYFCGVPMNIDLKLSTVDAPNAGSVLLDVIRAMKIAADRKIRGAVDSICAYAFKHPPKPISLEKAQIEFSDFVEK
jgi:myo-inositol-1-phosphate synthase